MRFLIVRCFAILLHLVSVATISATYGQQLGVAKDLSDRHIVGYQGWFTCPRDHVGGWGHWFRGPSLDKNRVTVDMFPNTDDLSADERCDTGRKGVNGKPLALFSSLNEQTIKRHFVWIREHNIDGVALQRFLSEVATSQGRAWRDRVLLNVMKAAQSQERAFFITYDISGADPALWTEQIKADWDHLTRDLHITEHPSYWHHLGKPVLEIWGAGFQIRPGTPEATLNVIRNFKEMPAGTTLIGGIPSRWRTLNGDSKQETAWRDVYRAFDIISPWTVGRFRDPQSWQNYIKTVVVPDIEALKLTGQDYLPVIWPGFSAGNRSHNPSLFNHIKRDCGSFYIMQAQDLRRIGIRMVYTAMFDEVDEGTAIFKILSSHADAPADIPVVTIDEDHCGASSPDLYLRLASRVSEMIHQKSR